MPRPIRKDPEAARAKFRAPVAVQKRFAKLLADPLTGLAAGLRAGLLLDDLRRATTPPRRTESMPTDKERDKIREKLLAEIQEAVEPDKMSAPEARELLLELIEDIRASVDGIDDDLANAKGA